MKKIGIIDYGMGNLFSMAQAIEHLGAKPVYVSLDKNLMMYDALVLPGVGAFEDAMHSLRRSEIVEPIQDFLNRGKPFLGVCLGMQLLMDHSEEHGFHEGLKRVPGLVRKLSPKNKLPKIPQVGWNQIQVSKERSQKSIFDRLGPKSAMYFVHSYVCEPQPFSGMMAMSDYDGDVFCAGFQKDLVCGVQFHPEKSGEQGLKLLGSFLDLE